VAADVDAAVVPSAVMVSTALSPSSLRQSTLVVESETANMRVAEIRSDAVVCSSCLLYLL
jgi:predicted RNase H-like nuclease